MGDRRSVTPRGLGERLNEARAQGRTQRCRYGAAVYERITDDVAGLSRGAVAFPEREPPALVPAFPAIARVVALGEGARRHLAGPFRAEEKIDGFNVRVARERGETLAFTRGGFACPFTTDRLPDLADFGSLFREEPDAVVGAEVAGAGSPYLRAQARHYSDDVALFAFDLSRLGGREPEPLARRDALFERHGIPRAPELLRCDRCDDAAREMLRALALELDAYRAEGMILKPEAGSRRLKYVTPSVNLGDIAADAGLLAELGEGFFTSRALRFIIGARELGAGDRLGEFERGLGSTLSEGMQRTLAQIEAEGEVYEDLAVRVRDPAAAEGLVAHLNRSSRLVQAHELWREPDGAHTRVGIRKVLLRSTSYLKSLLRGDPIVD